MKNIIKSLILSTLFILILNFAFHIIIFFPLLELWKNFWLYFVLLLLFHFTIFYFYRKNVYIIVLIIVIFIYSVNYSFSIIARDIVYYKKCFVFGKSYPGIKKYDDCVQKIKFEDYLKYL